MTSGAAARIWARQRAARLETLSRARLPRLRAGMARACCSHERDPTSWQRARALSRAVPLLRASRSQVKRRRYFENTQDIKKRKQSARFKKVFR